MACKNAVVFNEGICILGGFLSKLKNREEFEGGLREKGRGKGRKKKEKSYKTH